MFFRQGDGIAQFRLGTYFSSQRDHSQARYWFEKVAMQDLKPMSAFAALNVASICAGRGKEDQTLVI